MRSVTDQPSLWDRYALAEAIGHGADASLYRGTDLHSGEAVVVKRYDHRLRHDIDFVANFRRGARQARALRHPYVLRLLAYGYADEGYYTVSPFIDGGHMGRYIPALTGRGGRPGAVSRDAIEALTQACLGLDYIHGVGLLHLNLKPANILLRADGDALLADMALTRRPHGAAAGAGDDALSIAYLSPEQVVGDELSPASDIYALGVILYQVCTGRLPFKAPDPADPADPTTLAQRQGRDEPPSPRTFNPRINATLEAVVLRCLATEPTRRYTSANNLAAALAECQASLGQDLTETGPAGGAAPGATRGRLRTPLHGLARRVRGTAAAPRRGAAS
jgi:serine/threonine protein kinase